MLGGYGKAAQAAAYPLAGFFGIVLIWSLLVGDFHTTTLEPSSIGPDAQPATASQQSLSWPGWDGITDMFVFGDAFSATSFDFDRKQPKPENPFGNDDFLDGAQKSLTPNWIQHLKGKYRSQDPLLIYNLARHGAFVEKYAYHPARVHNEPGLDCTALNDVVRCWKTRYATPFNPRNFAQLTLLWEPATTLFALWYGVDEVMRALEKDEDMPASSIFASYSTSIHMMYQAGAQHFLILNAPAIDRATPDTTGKVKRDLARFNERLDEQVAHWRKLQKDATVFFFDVYSLTADILDEPHSFPQTAGLRELQKTCPAYTEGLFKGDMPESECAYSRDGYFWLDSLHFSSPVHEAIAARIVSDCFGGDRPTGYCK